MLFSLFIEQTLVCIVHSDLIMHPLTNFSGAVVGVIFYVLSRICMSHVF